MTGGDDLTQLGISMLQEGGKGGEGETQFDTLLSSLLHLLQLI